MIGLLNSVAARPTVWISKRLALVSALMVAGCERPGAPHAQHETTEQQVQTGDVVLSTADFPCTLEFERTGVTLRSDASGSIPDPMFPISRAPDGRFYTATRPGTGQVAIWSADGTFLRTFGRPGAGPGEFGVAFAPRVDTRGIVHVFGFGSGRWQRFTRDGELLAGATSTVIGFPENLAIIGNDTILSSMPFSNRQFHIVDGAGNLLKSFGEFEIETHAGQDHASMVGPPRRAITFAGGRTFWAAPRRGSNEYVLEEWTLDGTLVRRIVRDVSWFPKSPKVADPQAVRVPSVLLYAGPQGHLLVRVLVRVPDEATGQPGESWYEVIDLRVPSVLASRRVLFGPKLGDVLMIWGIFPGTQLGIFEREDELGLPIVDIVRYSLKPETSQCTGERTR